MARPRHRPGTKDPERAARRLVHIPMGRFAEAGEIAAAVAFLADGGDIDPAATTRPRTRAPARPTPHATKRNSTC